MNLNNTLQIPIESVQLPGLYLNSIPRILLQNHFLEDGELPQYRRNTNLTSVYSSGFDKQNQVLVVVDADALFVPTRDHWVDLYCPIEALAPSNINNLPSDSYRLTEITNEQKLSVKRLMDSETLDFVALLEKAVKLNKKVTPCKVFSANSQATIAQLICCSGMVGDGINGASGMVVCPEIWLCMTQFPKDKLRQTGVHERNKSGVHAYFYGIPVCVSPAVGRGIIYFLGEKTSLGRFPIREKPFYIKNTDIKNTERSILLEEVGMAILDVNLVAQMRVHVLDKGDGTVVTFDENKSMSKETNSLSQTSAKIEQQKTSFLAIPGVSTHYLKVWDTGSEWIEVPPLP